jgi:hypothetical protein
MLFNFASAYAIRKAERDQEVPSLGRELNAINTET